MLDARVIGFGHSTIKHPSMKGVRLALCEGLTDTGEGDGKVFLAADWQGAGVGQRVFVTTDGEAASLRTGFSDTPLRNAILGICDEEKVEEDQ
ncbi:MAG: EutN/CcmL family microcompartment protein [Puniceicoccales bacterium]